MITHKNKNFFDYAKNIFYQNIKIVNFKMISINKSFFFNSFHLIGVNRLITSNIDKKNKFSKTNITFPKLKKIKNLFSNFNNLSRNFSTNYNKMDANSYMNIKRSNSDIILTPKEGYDSVLIFLHGLGDSADGYLDFFLDEYKPIPNRMKVILLTAPKSPVTVNGGDTMNSWYDILSFERGKDSISETDVVKNSLRIRKCIETEAKAQEINNDFKNIFLGGFSQGCCMALYVGMYFPHNLGGIVGLSGLLFPFTELNENKKNLPILLSHGEWDSVIPFSVSYESYERLFNGNYNIQFHKFRAEHTIDYTTMDEMKNFLKNLVPKF